jgi:electron-transferring-flavoprotein dehydrogenase
VDRSPQIYALGVMIWEWCRYPIVHTMGWPLPNDAFGGSHVSARGEPRRAGIVVGLDYRDASPTSGLLQTLKRHRSSGPSSKGADGRVGPRRPRAATLGPRAPSRGDFAGTPQGSWTSSLKDHYAMQSGICGARDRAALKAGTFGRAPGQYDRRLYIMSDMYKTGTCGSASGRLYVGGAKA